MKKNSLLHSMLLLLAAAIWGSAFVAQSVGMEHIGPFTFSAVRNTVGFIVLIPISLWSRRLFPENSRGHRFGLSKQTVIGGIICGVVLCASSNFQQCGMVYCRKIRFYHGTVCRICSGIRALFEKENDMAHMGVGCVGGCRSVPAVHDRKRHDAEFR